MKLKIKKIPLTLEEYYLLVHQAHANLRKVEKYVILTILLLPTIFLLNVLKKRYSNASVFKYMSSGCYTLLPILVTYTLGAMDFGFYPTLYTLWSIFLLIAYASLDNLSAFTLEERKGRSKLFFQFLYNFLLLALFFYYLPSFEGHSFPIMLVCFVVLLKVVERIIALGHATGATPGIKRNLINMIDYMNIEDEHVEVDPESMKGFHYLVGPRYSETKDGVIVRGITIENIWECNGSLLSSESGGGDLDGRLKDTCLSFSLFWLLLAKFWGYRLYIGNSKRNASKLVLNGLLSGKLGGVERVFRVIEVELSFLHDYFFSKYMVFYLHGFWMKLSFLSFPAIFWWSANIASEFHPNIMNIPSTANSSDNPYPPISTAIVIIVVISFVEVVQLWMLIASSWFKVALISFYANREMSGRKYRLFDGFYRRLVGGILRVSQCTGGTILSKPWKRQLDQYILLQSCTSFGVDNHFMSGLTTVFGSPSLPKLGRKQGKSVVLSETVKRAVVRSLQTNGLELSNGIMSLKRNGVDQDLSSTCKVDSDTESIVVWHVATSVCEMFPESQQTSIESKEDREVATTLSKYCAYLLVFSPSLLQVPILEAEAMSDKAIKEARKIFKKHVSLCGCAGEKVNTYEKLKEYLTDNAEVEEGRSPSLVKKGLKLGELLYTIVRDEDKRWKILAELWTEMILFMASSNTNEIAHIEKLAEGGEFITHLWALLIHAGIHK